ncbi:MAG: PD-(D/E)XK nuclease family protein [bacterium]|nr:PD-(D/E)XK nuclease family protein [bacterium]
MKLPQYSPSKLSVYLECPRQYRFQYVDRLPRRPWASTSLGLSVHRVMQAIHDQGGARQVTNGMALDMLGEHWHRAGFDSAEEEARAREHGRQMLERYLETWRDREGTPVWVEKRATAKIGHFRLLGILDRLDRHADGTLEIIDYKSGRMPEAPSGRAVLQMVIYDRLVEANLGEKPTSHALHYLATDTRLPVPIDDAVRESVMTTIEDTVGLIEREQTWTPRVSEHCDSCDYLNRCAEGRRHTYTRPS